MSNNAYGESFQQLNPSEVRYSQNTIGENIYPNIPVIKHPHTLPLNVILLPDNLGYLSYDNRRLYSARKSGVIMISDMKIDVVVHSPTDFPELDNPETTDIAWSSDDGIFILSLQSITWFGSISMRCVKQAPRFPLTGSHENPVCQQSTPRLPDQFIMKQNKLENVTNIAMDDWHVKLSEQQMVMVKIKQGFNVYHSREDLPTLITRFQDHFKPMTLTFYNNAIFKSRVMGGGSDDNSNNCDFEDDESCVLMGEFDDMLEYAWIEQQLDGKFQL